MVCLVNRAFLDKKYKDSRLLTYLKQLQITFKCSAILFRLVRTFIINADSEKNGAKLLGTQKVTLTVELNSHHSHDKPPNYLNTYHRLQTARHLNDQRPYNKIAAILILKPLFGWIVTFARFGKLSNSNI